MPTEVTLQAGATFLDNGIPAANPFTPSVAAAANDTLVLLSMGGDSDTGFDSTWTPSSWLRLGQSQSGGSAYGGRWDGAGNPPNPTIAWSFDHDRFGGAWAAFAGYSDYDYTVLATGSDGPINPPQHQAKRRMGFYDLWVVMTGHRDGTFALPAGWSTAHYINHASRAGGIQYKKGEGESLFTPPRMSSVDVTTQVTITIAVYGTPPAGGGIGFGRVG